MLISVVVTVRNEEKRLSNLLDSLMVQEAPFEIVVVEAYSDDGTYGLLQDYAKRHDTVRVFRKGGTRGVGRNYGVRMAKGDVVAFTDGDCIVNPFWLKEIRRSFTESDPEIVAGRTITLGYAPFAELDRVE